RPAGPPPPRSWKVAPRISSHQFPRSDRMRRSGDAKRWWAWGAEVRERVGLPGPGFGILADGGFA
ncbi:MAG TPA: hypothetical protein VHJ83_07865, partial [Micromonosporaceae bacterium]|nr:hypothetical protein [Micromonosporaceae bacterium]